MNIPIEIFTVFLGVSLSFLAIGLTKRIGVAIFVSGIFIFSIAIMTDNLIMSSFIDGGTEDIIHYDQQSFTGVSDIFQTGGNDIRGEYVFSTSSMLFGDTIDCIDLTLRKSGSPTGTAIIGVYDHAQSINNPLILEFGDIDVSTLNSGFSSWYSFCLPLGTTYTIGDQDVLGIRYDAGDSNNFIRTNVATADAFDSTTTRYTSKSDNSNLWTDTTTSDLTAIFYLRGEESELIYDSFIFTELIKILFALVGIMIMLLGVLYSREL